jgi:hypothetical protein
MNPIKGQILLYGGGALALGFLVYKFAQKIGLVKTKEEEEAAKNAASLDTGASGNANVVNASNPALSLNPKYWLAIFKKYQKDNKKTNLTIAEISKILNPDFTNGKSYNVNLAATADLIWNSKKVFFLPDKEEKTYGAFRSLRNQAQVSKMADIFFDAFKTDLLGYMQSFMNDTQQAKIYEIVKSKPLV